MEVCQPSTLRPKTDRSLNNLSCTCIHIQMHIFYIYTYIHIYICTTILHIYINTYIYKHTALTKRLDRRNHQIFLACPMFQLNLSGNPGVFSKHLNAGFVGIVEHPALIGFAWAPN